jgi:hypothetical protein
MLEGTGAIVLWRRALRFDELLTSAGSLCASTRYGASIMTAHRSPNNRGSSKAIQQRPDEEVESRLVSRALQSAGGAGGISGTGQASPHHGFDDDDGRQAAANPAGDEARLPMPETGSSYQTGGTHLNRDRQAETRKGRLAGSTIASGARGGLDAAPGAPLRRGE